MDNISAKDKKCLLKVDYDDIRYIMGLINQLHKSNNIFRTEMDEVKEFCDILNDSVKMCRDNDMYSMFNLYITQKDMSLIGRAIFYCKFKGELDFTWYLHTDTPIPEARIKETEEINRFFVRQPMLYASYLVFCESCDKYGPFKDLPRSLEELSKNE